MYRVFFILTAGMLCLSSCRQLEPDSYPSRNFPPGVPGDFWELVQDPSALNWDEGILEEARQLARKARSESIMIIDDGRLIAAWGDTQEKYYVASVRKSFLGTLFGYYTDSLIDLNATIGDLGITDKEGLSQQEQTATIRQLLSSSSGIFHPAAATDNADLPARNSQLPGASFYYNNWDFNALGTIYEQVAGIGIFEDFQHRIADKIDMEDFVWQNDGRYDFSDVSQHPAYHFDMTTRDMARFGLLILNRGNWNGEQVVPEAWIDSMTTAHTSVGEEFGGGSYGYMWWVNDEGIFPDMGFSSETFSAQGNWSQLILIDPITRLVIVHRAKKRTIDGAKLAPIIQTILEARQ